MSVTVRTATVDDLRYVVSLMRKNRESVGGLPEPAIMERLQRGTVELVLVNDDPVGYVLYDLRGGILRIPQACIQFDARRRQYGIALMQRVMGLDGIVEVRLRCAADLEANIFWRDLGFTCVSTERGGIRRGRMINLWTFWLGPALISIADFGVIPASAIRQDSMYDDSGFLLSTPQGFSEAVQLPKLAWSNRKAPR